MVTVFLPCRAGSQRIPHKNTKRFSGVKGGLLTIKLRQLLNSERIDRILVSTNDPEVTTVVEMFEGRIQLDHRPEHLASSDTSTDELINYVCKIVKEGHVLWTHVTSPFVSGKIYDEALNTYFEKLKEGSHDSLMSVNRIKSFLWDEHGSINYDRSVEKWPRTQTLKSIYEVNSGIFLSSIENYRKFKDRIGDRPYLFETNGLASFDIDWPEDFEMAERIYSNT